MSETRVVHVNDNIPGAVYIGRGRCINGGGWVHDDDGCSSWTAKEQV